MANQWLKRCCVGAMIAAVTVSSLPMQAFAEAGGGVLHRRQRDRREER